MAAYALGAALREIFFQKPQVVNSVPECPLRAFILIRSLLDALLAMQMRLLSGISLDCRVGLFAR
jgi:hypothetical protein